MRLARELSERMARLVDSASLDLVEEDVGLERLEDSRLGDTAHEEGLVDVDAPTWKVLRTRRWVGNAAGSDEAAADGGFSRLGLFAAQRVFARAWQIDR